MKHIRAWIVIASLLAGCTAGAADTDDAEGTVAPQAASQTTLTAQTSQSGDRTPSREPVPLESVGADARDDSGFLPQPVPLPPGTYRSSMYPVPVTFTTTDEVALFAVGVTLTSDTRFSGVLEVSQPDKVADLSRPISREDLKDAGQVNIPEDRLIDMPDDIGAWLGNAAAIDIVSEGSTTVGGEQAQWWDLELQDRGDGELACQAEPGPPPCQGLWPDGPQTGGGGFVAANTVTRIWAVPAASRTVMVVALTQPPADESATSAWFDTAEQIVASLKFD